MKEEKDLNQIISGIADETAAKEDIAAEITDVTAGDMNEALNEELEGIKRIFQEELNKATKADSAEDFENNVLIEEVGEEKTEVNPEDLCACCGENLKDTTLGENYEYCAECREAMRRYPISFQSVIVLAVIMLLSVFSVRSFISFFPIYNTMYEGDEYLKENRVEMALDSYDGAASAFEDNEINPRNLYLKTARILTDTMPGGVYSMEEISLRVEKALSYIEASLPIYSEYADMREDALVLYNTMQEFYNIINSGEYRDFATAEESIYIKMQNDVEKLINKELTITDIKGEDKNVIASEPMIRFCQYMCAFSRGNSSDAYEYLKMAEKTGSDYIWMYAYELGETELKKGNIEEATRLAGLVFENNRDSSDSYALYSSIYRMSGDADKAIEEIEKGLSLKPESAELYRLLAMAYIAQGENELACEAVGTALEYDRYAILYMVGMVAQNEVGNEDIVSEYKKILEDAGMKIPERLERYFNGDITARQLFTESIGDVE